MMKAVLIILQLFTCCTSTCLQSTTSSITYSVCKFCTVERFSLFTTSSTFCNLNSDSSDTSDTNSADTIAQALLSYGKIQGHFWEDDQTTATSLSHLIRYMPIRDSIRLYNDNDQFLNFLFDHIRFALLVRTKTGANWIKNTTLYSNDIFLEYVLPYAFLDEKRDVHFKWRQRFYQLFMKNVSATKSSTEAMHYLAQAIPHAHAAGVLSFDNDQLMTGFSVHWESETSPMRMSPEDVIVLGGGSCTGTAIVMAAAARSVGIPARVTGCSQSIKDDDHHWIEFYDPMAPTSPFEDGWHTKEGTSSGNEGGPWDSPSAPMNGCLKYLVPKDKTRLNTIWSSSWSSSISLPLQWSVDSELSKRMAFVGGVNRCGKYCKFLFSYTCTNFSNTDNSTNFILFFRK